MASVKNIESQADVCTVVISFNLGNPSDLGKMSQVLGILAVVETSLKKPQETARVGGVKMIRGVSVPINFLVSVANKVGLPDLVHQTGFMVLCAKFLRDETLVTMGGGKRSDQAAQRIIELTSQNENSDDLSQRLADYAGGSSADFKDLAEILCARFNTNPTE